MIQELSILFLLVFMLLAIYDGLYLHLWKFELFNREESEFEHKIHTARAVLFPLIIYFLFIDKTRLGLTLGLLFFLLDIVVLAMDAYYEEESREFMNGLPHWEYIVHLFANSLHFASFILIIIYRIYDSEINSFNLFNNYTSKDVTYIVGINALPGAIFMALLHLTLTLNVGKRLFLSIKAKVLRHFRKYNY